MQDEVKPTTNDNDSRGFLFSNFISYVATTEFFKNDTLDIKITL